MQMYLLSPLLYWSSAKAISHFSHAVVVVVGAAAGAAVDFYNPKTTESAPSSSLRVFLSSGHEKRFQ